MSTEKGAQMDDLLASVLEAHGGLQNWTQITKITAKMSLGGPFWAARGWPQIYAGQTVTIDPHREHIMFAPFTGPDRASILDVDPERVVIKTADGGVIEERTNPRVSFPTDFDPTSTPWDAIQVAYFTSAAVWNYLTEPFVFTYPGVQAQEIEPWNENGQTWRRLAVTFPKTVANHNANQVFYYDKNFMQRRMDYSPDVTGKPPIAHYTLEPKTLTDSSSRPDGWCTSMTPPVSRIRVLRRSPSTSPRSRSNSARTKERSMGNSRSKRHCPGHPNVLAQPSLGTRADPARRPAAVQGDVLRRETRLQGERHG